MEVCDLKFFFLQDVQNQAGPGLVSTPAIIKRSWMVAAESLPSFVLQVKTRVSQKKVSFVRTIVKNGLTTPGVGIGCISRGERRVWEDGALDVGHSVDVVGGDGAWTPPA